METLLILFFLLILTPPLMFLIGAILFVAAPSRRPLAKRLLFTGTILLGIEILIGFAVCGNLNFH